MAEDISQYNQDLMRIGDLAKRTGKTARALRLYEEAGLLRPIRRESSGYRMYPESAVRRILFVEELQQLGYTLADICDILKLDSRSELPKITMARLQSRFQKTLLDVDDKITRLQNLRDDLADSVMYLAECSSCSLTNGSLTDCIGCEAHERTATETIQMLTATSAHAAPSIGATLEKS